MLEMPEASNLLETPLNLALQNLAGKADFPDGAHDLHESHPLSISG